MSHNDPSKQRATDARTTTTTETSVAPTTPASEPASGPLTAEEEKVIRMRYGKSLEAHEALEFAVGANEEAQLQLALMEANLLEAFGAEALDPDPATQAPRSVIADHIE